MNIPKPHFELARVYDDGSQETEIVSVVGLPWETKMDRRGFLGAGATAGMVLGALTTILASARVAEGQRQSGIPGAATIPTINGNCGDLTAHMDGVMVFVISPDGGLLVSGSRDTTIKLWGLPDGTLRKTLEGHKDTVRALAISPDGKLLASGSLDNTIKLWGLPDGTLRKTLEGHKDTGEALAISPDGKLLASGSFDHTIKLWNLPDGSLRKTLEGHKESVYALAISPDGRLLASGSLDNTITLWDLPDGTLRKTLEGHKNSVIVLAISPDGRLLASGSLDNTITLWDLPDGSLRKTLEGHKESVYALAISPDGKLLASGSFDHTIKLWDLPKGEFKTCLVDLKTTPSSAKGVTYQYRNEYGQVVSYTLPCGSPIPPGAVCTCNCVPGSYSPPQVPSGGGTYQYCTCVPVCVCMAVPVCQAHRLLHDEPLVRTMAEELLLLMGTRESEYMLWAADKAEPPLQTRIYEIIAAIEVGALSNPDCWPTVDECVARLDDPDDVIALMAAQILAQKTIRNGLRLDDELFGRVRNLIREANKRSPFPRSCQACESAW